MDRKTFIQTTALTSIGVFFTNHIKAQAKAVFNANQQSSVLLKEIRLQTSVAISQMVLFYGNSLGLPVLEQSKTHCSFQVGESVLTFQFSETDSSEPFYHFAFNIPENKIREAEAWQLERTSLIEPPIRLKDLEHYSNNVVHFNHWNAHSIFFYDPAGNVVEYIARHTLNNANNKRFGPKDFLCISEIGLVVDSVDQAGKQVSNHFELGQYNASSDTFLALGDAHGLVLFFDTNTKANFGTGRNRGVYATEIVLNTSHKSSHLQLEGYPYNLSS